MKETVQKLSIFKKIDSKFFRNSENTITILVGNKFTRHRKRTMKVIHVATRRVETIFAVKGHIFKVTTMRAAPEDTVIGRNSAMNHLINILNNGGRQKQTIDMLKKQNKQNNMVIYKKQLL